MIEELHVLHENTPVAGLRYDRKKDHISLVYEENWQFGAEGFPMSLSLPLSKKVHGDDSIRSFLQGLLPDHSATIEAWGKRFHISPRNPFDVIKHVGEDCAGALQFIRPERLALILSGELDSLSPLTEADLARRMEDIKAQARSIPVEIAGRFSLAGAQTKDALYFKNGQWFVPGGRNPSTHILKPELSAFPEHALNEHFCMCLAKQIGLPVARTKILEITGKKVLCVTRYDRVPSRDGTRMLRIHQEDLCQASGKHPSQKYQVDGGPSAVDVIKVMREFSDGPREDIDRFICALALNWIIAGTDAHSKNHSILHARNSFLRMAPIYDLASWLPYERDSNSRKIKLAMKIGGTYLLHRVDVSRWQRLESEAEMPVGWIRTFVQEIAGRIAERVTGVWEEVGNASGDSAFLQGLTDRVRTRAENCLAEMS